MSVAGGPSPIVHPAFKRDQPNISAFGSTVDSLALGLSARLEKKLDCFVRTH